MSEEPKATIHHRIIRLKKFHPSQKIMIDLVRLIIKEHGDDSIWVLMRRLQQAVRCQYYRAIADNPTRALDFTYALNCPPSGCKVEPHTRHCKNPRVCPWCFCRRTLKVYDALMEPGHKIRNLNNLVFWQRTVPVTSKLPFFRANYGPHTWLNATVTTQIVSPFYDRTANDVRLNHMGIQLVPKTKNREDILRKLDRLSVNPKLTVKLSRNTEQKGIFRFLSQYGFTPWSDLYLAENLEHFIKILDIYPNKKLMRISRYNPLRKNNGD